MSTQCAQDPVETPDWHRDAACAEVDPDLWFPEKGGSTRDAKRICVSCEIRTACLQYALEHDERFGVWGGLSERERRNLQRASVTVARRKQLADATVRPRERAA